MDTVVHKATPLWRPGKVARARLRLLCVAVCAGMAVWLLPVSASYANSAGGYFTVSVRVVGRCNLDLADMSLPDAKLVLACARGTGYQVMMDGRAIGAGLPHGAPWTLPLSGLIAAAPDSAVASKTHWLTILY